jgi:hypothetical protein
MSGILSLSPVARRWVFASMNWYFLQLGQPKGFWQCHARQFIRNHLLETVYGTLHLGAVGHIVFHSVDEGRDGDTARVCGRIAAATRH